MNMAGTEAPRKASMGGLAGIRKLMRKQEKCN